MPLTPPGAGCGACWLRIRDEMDVTACGVAISVVSGCDVEGAVPVAEELVAVRARPQVATALEHDVGPRRVRFEPMMPPAEPGDVATARGSALGVGNHVVAIGTPGGAGAPRKHAGLVNERGLLDEPVRCLVGGAGEVLVQVQHGPHGDGGAGGAAPGADLRRW